MAGEPNSAGSMFSELLSSWKISGARWRLPVAAVGDGFNGDAKLGEMAFCLFFALCSACKRDEPSSPNGWRVKVVMIAGGPMNVETKGCVVSTSRRPMLKAGYATSRGVEESGGVGVVGERKA